MFSNILLIMGIIDCSPYYWGKNSSLVLDGINNCFLYFNEEQVLPYQMIIIEKQSCKEEGVQAIVSTLVAAW